MSLRISARLTIWYVVLLAAAVVALGLFLVLRLQAGLVRGVDEGLATRAAQISLGLQNGCEGEFQDVSDASLVGLPQGESGAQFLGPDGGVRESAGDPVAQHPLIGPAEVRKVIAGDTLRRTVSTGGDTEGFRLLAVHLPSPSCEGVIVVATSLEEVRRSVRELLLLLIVAGPIAILLAGVGGWLLARRALAPVGRMTREAGTVGIEHLNERVEVPAALDELHDLAVTLNSMLDRLEQGVEDKRRFAADASHELRTPLAVMRSELEVNLRAPGLPPGARAALESAQEEVERMRTIVENLLTLARAEDGTLELLTTPTDLREVAGAAAAAGQILARPRRVRLITVGPSVELSADRARIEQVLTNLISNAVRFSPEGGAVTVTTWSGDDGSGCTVRDEGPGVAPELAGRVFERFVRSEPMHAPGGATGLGLSISKEIVEAHGGRIWLEDRDGPGTAFSFQLPLAPRATLAAGEEPREGSVHA